MKLPKRKASLIIEHNPHKNYYETVEEHVNGFCPDSWASEEERVNSIMGNELWTIQWYPETPVGFCVVHASTLDAALAAANEDEDYP